jgi:hypothetical protein
VNKPKDTFEKKCKRLTSPIETHVGFSTLLMEFAEWLEKEEYVDNGWKWEEIVEQFMDDRK